MNKYLDLFLTFLKIGATTFGGGYAMISQIKDEIVDRKKWMTDDELLEITAIAESTPGPISVNLATYVGYKKAGFWGSLLATVGVVIPSFTVIYAISFFFNQFLQNQYVAWAFVGIKGAVAYLIVKAAIDLMKKMPKKAFPLIILVIVTVLMLLFDWFSINFSSIFLIIIGGVLGVGYYTLADHLLAKKKKQAALVASTDSKASTNETSISDEDETAEGDKQ
jgi:chromate transporter